LREMRTGKSGFYMEWENPFIWISTLFCELELPSQLPAKRNFHTTSFKQFI